MPHADAMPVLGTLIAGDGLQFRVTVRCLREDLGFEGPVGFAQVLDGPIGTALAGQVDGDSEDAALSRPASTLGSDASRLLLHPSGEDGVLWMSPVV